MSDFINEKVYAKVARKHEAKVSMVRAICEHVGQTIQDVIKQNDPSVSVKIDGLGNFVSFTNRRKKLEQHLQNKKEILEIE